MKKLFKWRAALRADRELKGLIKLMLVFLSLFMDESGSSCFPSTRTLALETGLSERSVCTHLEIATKEGWLKKMLLGLSGQGWKRHSYEVAFPEKALKEIQHVNSEGTERDSARLAKGTEPNDKKALKEVQSSTSMNTSNTIVPKKNEKQQKPTTSGTLKKRGSELKPKCVATEIYETYINTISPETKNSNSGVYNISRHLKKHAKEDLIESITNYKGIAKGKTPEYRKAPHNFFGIKKGNEFFVDYLPSMFQGIREEDKPINQQEGF